MIVENIHTKPEAQSSKAFLPVLTSQKPFFAPMFVQIANRCQKALVESNKIK
jgi:hypothetical protein